MHRKPGPDPKLPRHLLAKSQCAETLPEHLRALHIADWLAMRAGITKRSPRILHEAFKFLERHTGAKQRVTRVSLRADLFALIAPGRVRSAHRRLREPSRDD